MGVLLSLFGVTIFFSGILGLIISRSYLISLFLCLEVLVIGVLSLTLRKSFLYKSSGIDCHLCLCLLAIKACEAASGLALTVSFSRRHGKTLIRSANLLVS